MVFFLVNIDEPTKLEVRLKDEVLSEGPTCEPAGVHRLPPNTCIAFGLLQMKTK